jgi:biotin transport system substrate-specific component
MRIYLYEDADIGGFENMKTRDLVLVAFFAAMTAVGAFITIPLPFVPITMQFFFCALAGLLLGSKLGMLSQLVYVAAGLVGFPIFTKGGGITYIFQPSFGYLIGFVLGAYVIGKVREHYPALTYRNLSLAILSGLGVIYLVGVPYLYTMMNLYLGQGKSMMWAVKAGLLTALPGDLLKTILIVVIAKAVIPSLENMMLQK